MATTTSPEDRPIRSLAIALALTLALPVAVAAQDASETETWPTADELRRDLQGIGYEFELDPSNMALSPEWRTDLPVLWTLTEPTVVDDAMPEEGAYDALILRIVDVTGQPAQLLFGATSVDQADGEIEDIMTVLMEIAARLPDDAGLDAAAWYISNIWLADVGGGVTTLPCLSQEFDGGAMVVWRGGDGEQLESFFGTIAHFEGTSSEVEQCRELQAQTADAPTDPAVDETPTDPAEATETVDYSVPPAEAVELIEAGGHTIIDVRTPEEYEAAHVVGAINFDVEAADFGERIAGLDPAEPHLLYCRSGRRSNLAAQQMTAAGFTDIVDGAGLADLARAGAPIE